MKIGTPQREAPVPSSPEGIDYLVNVFGLTNPETFYHCPCCGYPTLSSRGHFDLCAVCYWEDDGQDSHDADRVRGGPNSDLSLTMARANFAALGACEAPMLKHVRPPTDEEIRHRKK